MVKGEYWRAESVDDNIGVDENVEIVRLEFIMRQRHLQSNISPSGHS
ncbi:unnamed protein product [marine sediment metagenome]|uniref:Uncharacterized protein n=1 Tax=marine sediment metagenome TaxID=412755 RepID=X0ZP44_9ZZZZ